ncbi:PhzF family phenazine biosynthesis protein [Alteriqipengyuania lutimaris]|uniref:PhzF family phenazine biosynthesis protein n=1 Tax=Alteriqipengyuania lutimaris TaxID=1538146 RepID=A0A395LIP7_9SPHN|nr:PhzF family phenazine biosynthesis protein [Alteriqipengyuania lutimaris]MBB3034325.1 PhzF family phenazine biosynthesis protein [Alteriqipengyuania lutimaris]RDS76772.1 PhzF family phenazine biosynthesis protein [Alteriqipengyuania lutimaris]
MSALPYWHVDAFANRPFGGNQAAVMPLTGWLPDATLQAIAEENNFAETAFLVRDTSGNADWDLRWFTPTSEVALCGHATLAAGHVLLDKANGYHSGDSVTFRTRKAGGLEVRRMDEGYELALPITTVEEAELPSLLNALHVKAPLFESVSGAEQTTIVLLEDEAAVRALHPDMQALAKIDRMVICTAPGTETDIVSRVFVPAWGVPEDSVTGSAHAALAPFWTKRLGRDTLSAFQASKRGGMLHCRMDGERVWLGGPCVTVVEGRFNLPE